MTLSDSAQGSRPAVMTRGARLRGGRVGATSWLFLIIATITGVLFIMINPPLWGNDALSQYARSYQVSHGQLLPQKIDWGGKGASYGGDVPTPVWHLLEHVAKDLGGNPPEPAKMIDDPATYKQLESARYSSDEKSLVWFTNTAAYSPVPYAPAAVTSLVAEAMHVSVGTALRMMALACLFSYILPVFGALIFLRRSRARWLFFALALTPPALLQCATITADAMTNGLAVLFVALVFKASLMKRQLGRVETGLLYASLILLPLGKPSYLILAFLMFAVPASRLRWASALKWVSLGVSVVLWGIWTYLTKGIGDVLAFYRADYNEREFGMTPMIHDTLTHPLHFFGNVIRTIFYRDNFFFMDLIGSSGVRVPSTAMLMMTIAIVIAAGWVTKMRAPRKIRWVWAAVSIISLLALFGTLYVTFTPVGFYVLDGVQGRYFFPLWPLFALSMLSFVPLRWRRTERNARFVSTLVVSVVVIALALTLAKYWYVVWVGAGAA